jgi:hypothetical protein
MIKVRKFSDIAEAEQFLNGALVSGVDVQRGLPLVGKTLIFTAPAAATCTFVQANVASVTVTDRDSYNLLFVDIKAQLEAAIAGLKVYEKNGKIILMETTPASGVAITGAGTANAMLGFAAAARATKVYTGPYVAAPAVKPYLISINSMGNNEHIVTTDE